MIMIIEACSPKPGRPTFGVGALDGMKDPTVVEGEEADDEPAIKCDPLDVACLALTYPQGSKCTEKFTEAQDGMRMLTNEEIRNSISQALGIDASSILEALPRRDQGTKFQNATARSAIAENMVDNWSTISLEIASKLVNDATALGKLVSCKDANKACSDKLVNGVAGALWRAPPSAADLTAFAKLFATGKSDFKESAIRTITGLLMDPRFIYRIEGVTASESAYDLASRMSYFIWRSTPDAQLLAKAKDGSLSDDAVRKAEVDRMLLDPKAELAFRAFMTEWLGLNKIENLQLKDVKIDYAARRNEVLDKLVVNVFKSGGDFRIAFGKGAKDNVLTMPGFVGSLGVSAETSPVKRGIFFSQRILCRQVPKPPGNAGAFKAENLPAETTPRERLRLHEDNPSCAVCHSTVDPIGLGFETYDAIGNVRTAYESKSAIDAKGTMKLDNKVYAFAGTEQLLSDIGESTDIAACMTVTVSEYAMGVTPETDNSCELSAIQTQFEKGNFEWKSLIEAIVSSKSFNRKIAP